MMSRWHWRRWWPVGRRALYWAHRWLGIAGCLLFAIWFVSGVVMMYVGFPALTDSERLAGLAPLRMADARLGPDAATATLPLTAGGRVPRRVVLEMSGTTPVWRITDAEGKPHRVSASDGKVMGTVGAGEAAAIGQQFSGQATARWAEQLERDQWTVPNGLNPMRPLHRIDVGDAAGTELYVSAVNGEVVRDTTRSERFWNWLGAVPHWIYFTPLRADPPLWRDVVIWISGACIVSAATGIVIGILRVRVRRRYRTGNITPYRGWMAWHHMAGLVGGVFVLTWIISGWLSMDPNRWFKRNPMAPEAIAKYLGTGVAPVAWPPATVPRDARAVQLLWFDGRPLLQWQDGQGSGITTDTSGAPLAALTRDEVDRTVVRLLPGARTKALTLLTAHDSHWYGHHRARPLPIWRVEFDDPAKTWVHIDPISGQVLGTTDNGQRLRRWLFNGAHSLDFPWLIQYRPLWDVVVWVLSLAGLIVSVSGVVVGWRRLWRGRGGRAKLGKGARGASSLATG